MDDVALLAGFLRRLRRTADLSQREFACRSGTSKSALARAECARGDLPFTVVARAAAVIGARLAVLDASGAEVTPMSGDAVRDRGGRQFPAHLDSRHGDVDWWHGPERYSRPQPTYTFDRDRERRDKTRRRSGTPADHQLPLPEDPPAERARARRAAAVRRQAEERQRRFLAGELRSLVDGFSCSCPAGCEYRADVNEDLGHDVECACRCDVG